MRLIYSLLLLLSFAAFVHAKPIQFIHKGTGVAAINGTQYGETSFVITAHGDTAHRLWNGDPIYSIKHDRAEIALEGIGVFKFTVQTQTWVLPGIPPLLGFGLAGGGARNLFDASRDDAFLGWDMLTSFGPYVGLHSITQWVPSPYWQAITTDKGVLTMLQPTSHSELPGSFTAIVAPEPSSICLCTGSIVLLGIRRRVA